MEMINQRQRVGVGVVVAICFLAGGCYFSSSEHTDVTDTGPDDVTAGDHAPADVDSGADADDGRVDGAPLDPCHEAPVASMRLWSEPPGPTAGLVNVRIVGDAIWGPIPPGPGAEMLVEVPFDPYDMTHGIMRGVWAGRPQGEVLITDHDMWLTSLDLAVWEVRTDCDAVLQIHDFGDSGYPEDPPRATVRVPCSALPHYDGIWSPAVFTSFVLDDPLLLPGGSPVGLFVGPEYPSGEYDTVVVGIRTDNPLVEGFYLASDGHLPDPGGESSNDVGLVAHLAEPEDVPAPGMATSPVIAPPDLGRWHSLEWTTLGSPGRIRAVLLWQPVGGFVPIPDDILPGNSSTGFPTSPVDLCGLDPAVVPGLMVQMVFKPGTDGTEAGLASWTARWVAP